MKKFLAIVLTLCMALTLLPVGALAARRDDDAPVAVVALGDEAVATRPAKLMDGEADDIDWTAAAITISTVDELKAFAGQVNAGTSFNGQTVTLAADLDLENQEWAPIGKSGREFKGTFDGGEHTVSNLTVHGENFAGLFGRVMNGTVKNLTVRNATVSGVTCVAALVGSAYTGALENCHVTGNIQISGNYDVGGLTGYGYAKLTNCSVIGEDGSAVTGIWVNGNQREGDNVGGLMGFYAEGTGAMTDCRVENLTVTGTRKVGGLVGSTYASRTFINCSAKDVTVGTNATAEYADDNQKTMGVGGLIGLFNNTNTTSNVGGKLENCAVKNITLTNENDVPAKLGYVSGGTRVSEDFEAPVMAVDVAISGTNTGTNVTVNDPALSGNVVADDDTIVAVDGQYFSSLQEALAAAQDGATVKLLADVELATTLNMPRGMTLTIDGDGHKLTPGSGFTANGHSAAVAADTNAPYSETNSYTLKNLTFEGFADLVRVVRVNFCDAVIENCAFNDNTVRSVITSAYGKVTVKDSGFTGNTAGYAVIDIGSDVSDADDHTQPAVITGNRFAGNQAGTAVIFQLTPADVTGNDFTENTVGIAGVFAAADASITGNYFSENVHSGTNPNAAAVLAGPWIAREFTISITGNAFDNAMGKDGEQLPGVFVEDWSATYSAIVTYDLSDNYWGGASPVEGKDYGVGGDADVEADVTVSSFADSFTKAESVGATVTTHTEHTWVLGATSGRTRTDTCEFCGETRTVTLPVRRPTTPVADPVENPENDPENTPEEDLNDPDVPLAALPLLFADVSANDWFYDAVKYISAKDIMKGTNAEGTRFAPKANTTRGSIATILHRMADTPDATMNDFADVLDGAWYVDAVNWTDANGLMIGFEDGTFRPEDDVTREQLVTVLYRYAKFLGRDVTAAADLSAFADADAVASWSADAMGWAVSIGLIQGRGAATLAPQGVTTRGELAVILQRFLETK